MNEHEWLSMEQTERLLSADQIQACLGPAKRISDRRVRPIVVGSRTLLVRNPINQALKDNLKRGRII